MNNNKERATETRIYAETMDLLRKVAKREQRSLVATLARAVQTYDAKSGPACPLCGECLTAGLTNNGDRVCNDCGCTFKTAKKGAK